MFSLRNVVFKNSVKLSIIFPIPVPYYLDSNRPSLQISKGASGVKLNNRYDLEDVLHHDIYDTRSSLIVQMRYLFPAVYPLIQQCRFDGKSFITTICSKLFNQLTLCAKRVSVFQKLFHTTDYDFNF